MSAAPSERVTTVDPPAVDSIAERIRAATTWRDDMAPAHWSFLMRRSLANIGQAGTGLHAIVELLAMSDLESAHKEASDDGEGGDPLPRPIASGLFDAALILCRHVECEVWNLGRFGRELP